MLYGNLWCHHDTLIRCYLVFLYDTGTAAGNIQQLCLLYLTYCVILCYIYMEVFTPSSSIEFQRQTGHCVIKKKRHLGQCVHFTLQSVTLMRSGEYILTKLIFRMRYLELWIGYRYGVWRTWIGIFSFSQETVVTCHWIYLYLSLPKLSQSLNLAKVKSSLTIELLFSCILSPNYLNVYNRIINFHENRFLEFFPVWLLVNIIPSTWRPWSW